MRPGNCSHKQRRRLVLNTRLALPLHVGQIVSVFLPGAGPEGSRQTGRRASGEVAA